MVAQPLIEWNEKKELYYAMMLCSLLTLLTTTFLTVNTLLWRLTHSTVQYTAVVVSKHNSQNKQNSESNQCTYINIIR